MEIVDDAAKVPRLAEPQTVNTTDSGASEATVEKSSWLEDVELLERVVVTSADCVHFILFFVHVSILCISVKYCTQRYIMNIDA